MDILYIVGGSSFCDREDLRYSLRSVEQYAKGIERVILVGECPYWLSDKVAKLPHTQPYAYPKGFKEKHQNIMASLRYACENIDISEEFIVACSDHFLNKEVDYADYPFYAQLTETGTELPIKSTDAYGHSLVSTRHFLEGHDLPTRNMTLHRNMRMIKDAVLQCAPLFDEIVEKDLSVEPFVLVGNYEIKHFGIEPRPAQDYKIFKGSQLWKASPELTDCFSVRSLYYEGLQRLIEGMYKNPCKYEQ